VRLGGIGFAAALAGARADTVAAVARAAQQDAQLTNRSAALLADEGGALALFVFDEALRPGAAQLRNTAHRLGIDLALVSGDASAPVARRAAELGIDTALARLTPGAKRAWVREEQQRGRRVAMLGDGVNDAPVLAQADVSLALASGSRLAQARADFLLVTPRLESLAAALQLARRGLRVLRQNFGWALAYNLVAIPLAAFGWIGPLGASIGMAVSSLLVVANSLRIAAPETDVP
jgi:P-type Cu2+ transporter